MTGTDKQPVRLNISVLLWPDVVDEVDKLAEQEDRPRSQMLRVLISEAIAARAKRVQR